MSVTTAKAPPKHFRAKSVSPVNASHLLMGMVIDCKKSLDALRFEIKDTWGDVIELQRKLDNAFYDLEDVRDKYRKGSTHD